MKFKCVSTHPEPLADGRVVAPYEEFDLDRDQAEHPNNRHLFDGSKLLAYSKTGEKLIEEVQESPQPNYIALGLGEQEPEELDEVDPDNPPNPDAGNTTTQIQEALQT